MSSPNKKCISKDYVYEPFFLVQSNGQDKRYVISFHDQGKTKLFLFHFIDEAKNSLQIKFRDLDHRENPVEYNGETDRTTLKTKIETFGELIFEDGFNEFMIRKPENGDYLAYDDHDLVFLYTNQDYSPLLKELGIPYRPDKKIIYQFQHWHYRPPNAEKLLGQFVKELELSN